MNEAEQFPLIEVPEQLSPRLSWLRARDVNITRTNYETGDEDEFGNEMFPWYARVGLHGRPHGGATEHDAVVALAKARGWRLWNEVGL